MYNSSPLKGSEARTGFNPSAWDSKSSKYALAFANLQFFYERFREFYFYFYNLLVNDISSFNNKLVKYTKEKKDRLHQIRIGFPIFQKYVLIIVIFMLVFFFSENMNTVMAIILPVPGKRALDLLHRWLLPFLKYPSPGSPSQVTFTVSKILSPWICFTGDFYRF